MSLKFCTLNPAKTGFEWNEEFEAFKKSVIERVKELRVWLKGEEEKKKNEETDQIILEVLNELSGFFKENPELMPEGLSSLLKDSSKQALNIAMHRLKEKRREKHDVAPLYPEKKQKAKRKGRDAIVKDKGGDPAKIKNEKPGIIVKQEAVFGAKWRSNFQNGIIIINVSHQDWEEIESKGSRAKKLYISQLIWFECGCLQLNDYSKTTFRSSFENYYFPLTKSWSGK